MAKFREQKQTPRQPKNFLIKILVCLPVITVLEEAPSKNKVSINCIENSWEEHSGGNVRLI